MTPNAGPLNVVVVDDHVALRRGMEVLLRRHGHHVVGTADDAKGAETLILRPAPTSPSAC
jgi:DNA-binding NarL/FixJ family response regulator